MWNGQPSRESNSNESEQGFGYATGSHSVSVTNGAADRIQVLSPRSNTSDAFHSLFQQNVNTLSAPPRPSETFDMMFRRHVQPVEAERLFSLAPQEPCGSVDTRNSPPHIVINVPSTDVVSTNNSLSVFDPFYQSSRLHAPSYMPSEVNINESERNQLLNHNGRVTPANFLPSFATNVGNEQHGSSVNSIGAINMHSANDVRLLNYSHLLEAPRSLPHSTINTLHQVNNFNASGSASPQRLPIYSNAGSNAANVSFVVPERQPLHTSTTFLPVSSTVPINATVYSNSVNTNAVYNDHHSYAPYTRPDEARSYNNAPESNPYQAHPQVVYVAQPPRRYTQRDYPQLPKFSGLHPEEWPSWIAYLRATTEQYAIPNHENFERIKKSIVDDSPAFMAVKHLLHLPHEGDTIIGILRDYFGQPHFILQKLKEKAERFPQVTEDRMDRLLALCADVENLVATLRSCPEEAHLIEGTLLMTLLRKLPPQMQLKWGESQHYGLHLNNFNLWLRSIRPAAIRIIDQPLNASAWRQSKMNPIQTDQGRNSRRLNVHQTSSDQENSTRERKCKVCKQDDHSLADCEGFRTKSVDERWKLARGFKVCFCCLNSGHGSDKCNKGECEIDGCNRKHHGLLHTGSKNHSGVHTAADDVDTLFKIIPVKVYGPHGVEEILAFIDEGSNSTVADANLCKRLGITGVKSPFCVEWSDGTTRFIPSSMRVSIKIRGLQANGKQFELSNVRTVDKLELPLQKLDATKLRKTYRHLENVPAAGYSPKRPQLLIGISHYSVCLPKSCKSGASNEPFAVEMPIGWTICGPNGREETPNVRLNFHKARAAISAC